MKRRILTGLFTLIFLSISISAMGETSSSFVLIVPDESNLYMRTVYRGFSEACAEFGLDYRLVDAADSNTTISTCIERALAQGVAGIAVSCDGIEDINEQILATQNAKVPLVISGSLPSPLPPSTVRVGTRLADIIGVALIQSAYEILDGHGKIAVVSNASNASKQFLSAMTSEMDNNPEVYAQLEIVEIVQCHDDPTIAVELTKKLLTDHPDLNIIISTTTIGLSNAAKAIVEARSNVKVTGLGLPSEMSEYILSGVCPQMFLWNPLDIGYLAAYTLYNLYDLQQNNLAFDTLSSFVAGRLGERIVATDEEGRMTIRVGNFMIFDRKNILFWNDTF